MTERTDDIRKDVARVSGLIRRQLADDLGVALSSFKKWMNAHRGTGIVGPGYATGSPHAFQQKEYGSHRHPAKWARRSARLEAVLPKLYLNSIATGDFKRVLAAITGHDAQGLAPSVVSRLMARRQVQFDACLRCDLSARHYADM